MVADAFIGNGEQDKASIKEMAQTAMHLPISVIETPGTIPNEEYPTVFLHKDMPNRHGSNSADELVKYVWCSSLEQFLHTSSLKAATAFMNESHPETREG